MTTNVERTRVGKYDLGKTLGEGTFAKVKLARHIETGQEVAIKILDKEKILKHKMVEQIKREITTMKLVKHPYVVQLLEVRHFSPLYHKFFSVKCSCDCHQSYNSVIMWVFSTGDGEQDEDLHCAGVCHRWRAFQKDRKLISSPGLSNLLPNCQLSPQRVFCVGFC